MTEQLRISFQLPTEPWFQVERGIRRDAGSWKPGAREDALAIRMRRTESKKRVHYRVVSNRGSRTAREGSFVEVLGIYNPRTKPETVELKRESRGHGSRRARAPPIRVLHARCKSRITPGCPQDHQGLEASATAELPAS